MNVKYFVLLMLWNLNSKSDFKKVRGAEVGLLMLIVKLSLWAEHAGLFVSSFC